MTATYASYQALLEAKAADLDDAVAKAKCELLIAQYVDALEAQATTVATDVQSYTIGGRTVTRSQVIQMQAQVNNLERQINDILYGNTSYADFNVQVNRRYT